MKRIYAILAILLALLALAACGAPGDTQVEVIEMREKASASANAAEAPIQTSPQSTPAETGKTKILVAYFSCTGTTETVANYAAAALNADIYRIQPQEPYSDADLDYSDDGSRASREQNDAAARPVISGSIENMEQYDIVLLGYPIWWGDAPRIISTFLESYDFGGKTIVPFCTSGSSGIGSSADDLHGLCAQSAVWLDGMRFGAGASEEEVSDWLLELNIERTEE